MIGVQVETCPYCLGAGSNGLDVHGVRVCEYCGASGRVVVCMQCSYDMPEPEAAEHGALCGDCRALFDGAAA